MREPAVHRRILVTCVHALVLGTAAPAARSQDRVEIGEDVEVSVDPDGGALRVEPSVGVSGETVLVAWNDSYGGGHGSSTGVCAAWSVSHDGGRTFVFGGYLTRRDGVVAGADTRIARDGAGRLYLTVLSWFAAEHEIRLYRLDGDRLLDLGQVATNRGQGYLDKPAFAIDSGRFAVAYSRKGALEVACSEDGKAWSHAIASGATKALCSGAGVALRDERIVVGWCEGSGLDLDRTMVVESTDGGRTFSPPREVFVRKAPIPTPPGFRMAMGPAAVAFNDVRVQIDGAETTWLATLDVAVDGPCVALLSSRDAQHWERAGTAVVPAVDGAFFPDLVLLGDQPALLCYGVREGLTYSYLLFGGSRIQLASVGSDWNKTSPDKAAAPIQRNFGDYVSIGAQGDRFVAVWTDGRSGVPRIHARAGRIVR